MFQADLPLPGTILPSVVPREPDVVLKDVGERVTWKCTVRRAKTDHIQFVLDAAGTDSQEFTDVFGSTQSSWQGFCLFLSS